MGAEALGFYRGEGKWKACGLLNEGWEHVAVLSLVVSGRLAKWIVLPARL